MRKNLYLSGLLLCILTLSVCGCGSGGGSAADPMGTATIRFMNDNGTIITDPVPCGVNGTITLRVFVTNQRSDNLVVPVVNEKVSFVIVNPANGATLSTSDVRTGSDGQATCLFTSGNSTYPNFVRATTEGGATATITITKSGGAVDPYITTLEASSTTVVADQNSVITARVVDGSTNPVSNVLIRFRIVFNNSGAIFADASTDANVYALTDSGGYATAVYRAGSANATSDAYDTILVELENGSSKAVEIKRVAGEEPPLPTELSVALSAAPTSVAAGQTSIITATVSGDNKAGAAVTFTIPVNASGSTFINSSGVAVTTATVAASSGGVAQIIYRAGTGAAGTIAQDTVQARLTNAASAAIILTRTTTAPSVYTVEIDASSTSLSAGGVSIITATVSTKVDGADEPAAGVVVTFSLPVNSSGATLTATTVVTDASGRAIVIYRPGNTTVNVQDTVQAAVGTAVNAIAIEVKGSSVAAYSITITANPTTHAALGDNSVITATVRNNAGVLISGMTVNFAVDANGTLSVPAAVTDGSGNAVTVFTSTVATSQSVITASVSGVYTAAVVITIP